jgi:hypothetical protein
MLDTIALFTESHGIYRDKFKFRAILVFCTVLVVFSRVFGDDYHKIILLFCFGFIITELYTSTQSNFINDYNQETMGKMDKLQSIVDEYIKSELVKGTNNIAPISPNQVMIIQKKYRLGSMYMDANMIEFLYSIHELKKYNPKQFYKILKGTNNILNIRRQIEEYRSPNGAYLANIGSMLKVAISLKINLLNNLHDMIYTIPKTQEMSEYLSKSIEIYDGLLSHNIQEMYRVYKSKIESEGIHSDTVLVDDPGYKTSKSAYDTTPGRGYRYIV